MPDPVSALAAAKQIDEAVGLIAKLLGKLRAQPDLAALKLAAALDQIVDTYRVVDEAFTAYASLALDEDGLTSNSQQLFAIAGGSLGVAVSAGRGHCHTIGDIYWQHLRRWFERALNPSEQSQMEAVFGRLAEVDDDLFLALTSLADQLQGDAGEVLEDVMKGHHDVARQHVLETYRTLAPVQQAMAQGMQRMFALKDEFTGLARVAPGP